MNAVSVKVFWEAAGALDRETFLSEHPSHVLVGLRLPREDPRTVFGSAGGETAAITDGAPDDIPGPGPDSILLAIASRAGPAHSAKVTLGRAENNDIVVPDRHVSKLHGFFSPGDDGELNFTDSGSSNGTTVNDIAIPAYERVPMQTGDVIVFGTGAAFLYLSAEAFFLLLQTMMR